MIIVALFQWWRGRRARHRDLINGRILVALLFHEEATGYALMAETGLRSGVLYPALDRLERFGSITSRWTESDRPGQRRKLYSLSSRREADRE